MNRVWWGIGAFLSIFAVIVALLVPLTFGSAVPQGPIGTAPDDIRSLIANPPKVDCLALAKQSNLPTLEADGKEQVVLTYIPNEVDSTNPDARDTSNAVNVSAIPAERDRVNASICSQPEMAGMVGVGLTNNQLVGNESIVNINPDLFGQFAGITVKEWADKVFSGEISYADATDSMTQLAGVMTIAQVSTESRLSTWNYEALPGISTERNVRGIMLNDQEYTGDFLVYTLTHKEREGCWGIWGINVGIHGDITRGDQRIAGFTCETPPTATPSLIPSPTPTPDTPLCVPSCKDANKGITRTWDEEHVVNNNDGATDSQGFQDDPVGDALVAEEIAAISNEEVTQAHEEAIVDDTVVDTFVPSPAPAVPPGW